MWSIDFVHTVLVKKTDLHETKLDHASVLNYLVMR